MGASMPTFGIGGIASTGLPPEASGTPVLVLQPDGKLVMAGYGDPRRPHDAVPSLSDLLLTRVQPDGSLDTSFGTGGTVTNDLQSSKGTAGDSPCSRSPTANWSWRAHAWDFRAVQSISNHFDILLARYEALGCPAVDPQPCLAHLEAFVTDAYLAALGRTPDASEVAY